MVFKWTISKTRNFSSVIYTFFIFLFLFWLFFFFFDRFLILLTFHLFCSSSSRHRLLVALNYLPIELDYPYMRFYITIFHEFHEPWAMKHWWRSKLSVSDNRILNRVSKEKNNGLLWNERGDSLTQIITKERVELISFKNGSKT